jgi:hypothetical protein
MKLWKKLKYWFTKCRHKNIRQFYLHDGKDRFSFLIRQCLDCGKVEAKYLGVTSPHYDEWHPIDLWLQGIRMDWERKSFLRAIDTNNISGKEYLEKHQEAMEKEKKRCLDI